MHGLTLSSVENVFTLRQHGFRDAVKAQYDMLSRRPFELVGDHF